MYSDRWEGLLEEFDADASPGRFDALRADALATASRPSARVERGPPVHEARRKSFANDPESHDAALTLHLALRLPTPQAIGSNLLQHAIGRLDHHFKDHRGVVIPRKCYNPPQR